MVRNLPFANTSVPSLDLQESIEEDAGHRFAILEIDGNLIPIYVFPTRDLGYGPCKLRRSSSKTVSGILYSFGSVL